MFKKNQTFGKFAVDRKSRKMLKIRGGPEIQKTINSQNKQDTWKFAVDRKLRKTLIVNKKWDIWKMRPHLQSNDNDDNNNDNNDNNDNKDNRNETI